MLRAMRHGSRWILWIVIVGVGAVFVLYLGIGGGFAAAGGPNRVVAVGNRAYDARDVLRVRRNQEEEYRRVLGDGFDQEAAGAFLDEAAAGMLLRNALLAGEAERIGLHVSGEEVRRYLREQLPEGVDQQELDRIRQNVEREYGTAKRFEAALRDDLLARKLGRLIEESVAVSDGEALDSLRYQREEVSLAIVRLDARSAPEDLEIAEADVEAFLEREGETVRAAYEERSDEFDRPEEVHARHVLVQVPPDAEEEALEEARGRAQELLARIRGGADLADVAMEASDDPGSKARGGDLGFFRRGRMVKAFEDAAFSLPVGEVSDLVQSVHGFHLIRVEEKRPAQVISFEEARRQIAEELLRAEKTRAEARTRAEELAEAVRGGQSLVDAARERSLSIQRPDALRHRPDGYVPGVGAAPELMTAAFALSEEQPSDPRIHEVGGGGFVLIQLLERKSPSDEELAQLVEAERQRLLSQRRQSVEGAWVDALRNRAAEAGTLVYDLTALQR